MNFLNSPPITAPELDVSQWFNTREPLLLEQLRGKVVMLHAFQMLCPGCVRQATPQALEIHRRFASPDFRLIGLHTVFEHHQAMQPVSLAVYLYENRYSFPVGVDRLEPGSTMPCTMRAYAMEGTPTTILIDRRGRIRMREFGHVPDLELGAAIGTLLAEPAPAPGDGN